MRSDVGMKAETYVIMVQDRLLSDMACPQVDLQQTSFSSHILRR